MSQRFRRVVERFLAQYSQYLFFAAAIFVVGVVFGSIVVHALDLDQKKQLMDQLQSFFTAVVNHQTASGLDVMWNRIASNLKMMGLLWILGLSIIGLPVIVILIFMKGFAIGFVIGFLAEQFTWKGFLFICMVIFPQNVLIIPAFLVTSVSAIAFTMTLIRNRFNQQQVAVYPKFLSFSATVLVMALVMVMAAGIEGYISPIFMGWVTPMLK
jgi:stage II sporulation protein M